MDFSYLPDADFVSFVKWVCIAMHAYHIECMLYVAKCHNIEIVLCFAATLAVPAIPTFYNVPQLYPINLAMSLYMVYLR